MGDNQTGSISITPMTSYDPVLSASQEFFPELRKHWGLGSLINAEDVPGRRYTGSQTWAGLYNTLFWIDSHAGIAGLLMTQLLPFGDPHYMSLYEQFERATYQTYC